MASRADAHVGNCTTLTGKNKDGSFLKIHLILSALWTHLLVKRFHLIGVIMNLNDRVRVALMNVAGQELRLRSCLLPAFIPNSA